MKKKDTIFVQIASYRDPQLIPTIIDLILQAKHSENLTIGICWQNCNDDETIDIFLDNGFVVENYSTNGEFDVIEMTLNGTLLKVIDVPHHESKGACWARHSIQQLYNKEKYTLQLDSHHRFVEDWDITSIEMLESLRSKKCKKPLLTGYIPSFDPDNDPKGRTQEAWEMGFDRFIPEGAVFFIPQKIENWTELNKPVNARFYSAHFCFTDGIFAEEVQHDPEYFFHGEEISIAVRAYTHGYDLFHPHRIIAWHEYTRKNRTKIWDDHTSDIKNEGLIELDWLERNNSCHKRNRILFGMDGEDPAQIDFGKYGFGDKRTLREYEEYAGISFEYRGVQQDTLDKKNPPNLFEYETEEEWKDSFALSNDIRILINHSDIGGHKKYKFIYVGVHNSDDKEIYRKDLDSKEITNYYKNGEWIDYQLIFLTSEVPSTYTIWPVISDKNGKDVWLEKITRDVEYTKK